MAKRVLVTGRLPTHTTVLSLTCASIWAIGATAASGVDFVRDVQPILETRCLSCHNSEQDDGGLRLDTLQAALDGGESGPAVVPSNVEESLLYVRLQLEKDDAMLMPPANADGPLANEEIATFRQWIDAGASWPDGVSLHPRERVSQAGTSPDDLALVRRIHEFIVQQATTGAPFDAGAMSDYEGKAPLVSAPYHMVALRGGEFVMGSPLGEANRQEDEGPQTAVRVDPFWIGKYEVTWDEYEPFMATHHERSKDGARKDYDPRIHTDVDAVSQPTAPYMEMSFGMGQKGYPAISMTQHAANKYCQWLSAQTGRFYRLPTEAEWEYACRAGTTTAYSFGDDPSQLDQYAWYYDNSGEKYQKVGRKMPNAWGLYDMHGNVMEWTADQFAVDYFERIQEQPENPVLKPESLYPRSVRGGGWDDDPDRLRSAARRGSEATWKQQDPQLPKSIWYHTDARWLGFRIVRPLKTPDVEEMYFYWNSAAKKR